MQTIYSPERVINTAADRIKLISHKKCYGLVTETYNDESNEVTYSIYVVTPKLKDYSYRLIACTIKGYINPFPIDSALFAIHPKNNVYKISTGEKSFANDLNFLIEHKITSVILDHLHNLASLKDDFKLVESVMSLSKENNNKIIDFGSKFEGLEFYKCILSSHISSDSKEWLPIILNTSLQFSCEFENGSNINYQMPLISYVGPNSINPILDLNFFFPSKSDLFRFEGKSGKCIVTLITNSADAIFELRYRKEEVINN